MEHILTNKIATLTELRDPKSVIEQAGDVPVAIMNRNQLEGYFVPLSAIDKIQFDPASTTDVLKTFKSRTAATEPVLDYLKDK